MVVSILGKYVKIDDQKSAYPFSKDMQELVARLKKAEETIRALKEENIELKHREVEARHHTVEERKAAARKKVVNKKPYVPRNPKILEGEIFRQVNGQFAKRHGKPMEW